MIKILGYYLFAAFFCLFRIFPVRRDKVFFIATHDDSPEGNAGIVAEALAEREPAFRLFFLSRRDGIHRPIDFFVKKAYHMATSGTIFMDNEFMPMAYTPVSRRTKVVQLWHGTGSRKIVRMAYNLYNNGTPSVFDYEDLEEQLTECGRYTVEELFCCGYAPYFWQAVKIRYPEYCGAA